MYQLTNSNLARMSRLVTKFSSSRICSTTIPFHTISTKNNHLIKTDQSNYQLPIRNLSLTQINLLKHKFDETKKEEVLFGEIKPQVHPLKQFAKDFGKIGIAVYLTVSVSTIAILYTLLCWGVDVTKIIDLMDLGNKFAEVICRYENASKFIVAYCISKVLFPIRLFTSSVIIVTLKHYKVKF